MELDLNTTLSVLSILGTLSVAFGVFFGIKYKTKENTENIKHLENELESIKTELKTDIKEQKSDLKELKDKREICNTSHNGKYKEMSDKLNEQISSFNEVKIANTYLIEIITRVVNECFSKNFKVYNDNLIKIIDTNKESLQDEINKDKELNLENQKKTDQAINRIHERIDKVADKINLK
ncbi:MAG: hypothetical protein M0P71_14675 [Melioribacteraceae bacterium]|jgi:DNA-binding protein H-NS|nr:hypothetical protein [Melioribacteraceae bacterium]